MIWLRSALFMVCLGVITPVFAFLMLLMLPFGHAAAYAGAALWTRVTLFLARYLCGIRYRILGTEHIPTRPTIVVSKHQSAWETILFPSLFPRQVHVVKRELLHVPFFGWGLAMLDPIAIDRGSGSEALRQVLEQGRDRLRNGLWVIIFPEGTRVAPGSRRRYGVGAASLAVDTAVPILPVAHNAGDFWRRKAFLKYPGTVTVSLGPLIRPEGLEPAELNARVESWIENEMLRIGAANKKPSKGSIENEPVTP
jgi:1-acyl-sn-glycerol-3-phosphate acyltransferase